MPLRTKSELLAHYGAFEEPNKFIQFDGFDWGPEDYLANPDTGLALFRSETHELMRGADVRVLSDREPIPKEFSKCCANLQVGSNGPVWIKRHALLK